MHADGALALEALGDFFVAVRTPGSLLERLSDSFTERARATRAQT